MTIYLPYASLKESATCLHTGLLYIQTNRINSLFREIFFLKNSHRRNFARTLDSRVWQGYEAILWLYWGVCIDELVENRGKSSKFYPLPSLLNLELDIPPWLGDDVFHDSHQSRLIRHYESLLASKLWDGSVLPYPEQFNISSELVTRTPFNSSIKSKDSVLDVLAKYFIS